MSYWVSGLPYFPREGQSLLKKPGATEAALQNLPHHIHKSPPLINLKGEHRLVIAPYILNFITKLEHMTTSYDSFPQSLQISSSVICLLFKFTLLARMSRQVLQAKFLILFWVFILQIPFQTCLSNVSLELSPPLVFLISSMIKL